MKYLRNNPANFPDALRNLAAAVVTAAVLGLALMFSAVLVALLALAAVLGWAYLWWKTRELRKLMRNQASGNIMMERSMEADDAARGEVIEGEAVRVVDIRDEK